MGDQWPSEGPCEFAPIEPDLDLGDFGSRRLFGTFGLPEGCGTPGTQGTVWIETFLHCGGRSAHQGGAAETAPEKGASACRT